MPMKKILVIEDEPKMRRNVLTILRLEKYQAQGAENGRAGLELAGREKPDLILCDVMMPELDAYGVLQALRDDPATVTIPFIFLTRKGRRSIARRDESRCLDPLAYLGAGATLIRRSGRMGKVPKGAQLPTMINV